jgi:putative FmdB family regulatory protein
MPIYEYSCNKCGATFEVRQKFSDVPVAVHEGCGGAVERLVSAPSFQFKGSGWYVTDYPRNAKPEAAKNSDSAKNSDGKHSDSKPEAAKDTKVETKAKTESKPASKTPSSEK